MSRLDIKTPSRAQTVVEGLYRDVERRIAASPPGLCPVEMSLSFLQLCHAQTCGKCVPCRIGLGQLTKLISQVLDGTANMDTVRIIEKTARSIVDTADCAIGRDAARLVVDGLEGFRDDYEEHAQHHRCLASLQNPVPCVALCPAGVDIPGYMALVGAGRYADAVRLIRKDNPMPTACAYICEHPCEARCRRNMIDDPINIRGLKRYAVDHAGVVPNPPCAPATGKTVAIVGGGPSGLSCAYYLALMGHKVTIFEECSKLGGMLRYGIPSYRFPREKLEKLKFLQSSPKRDALFWLIFTVPGTPKDLLCYFAGLTDLSWGKWLLLCTVGRLPSVLTSTIGGSALGVKDYQFAILVFAVTLAVSGVGLLIYRAICRRHERKQQEHE